MNQRVMILVRKSEDAAKINSRCRDDDNGVFACSVFASTMGRRADIAVLAFVPRTEAEQAFVDEQVLTRLAPGGIVIHGELP